MARPVASLLAKLRARQHVLCLPPALGDLPADGLVLCSHAGPVRKPIEHAGHIYQQRVIAFYSLDGPPSSEPLPNEQKQADSSRTDSASMRPTSQDAASKLASKLAVGSDDLYELLELGDKRWHATADDIKKSFRRISLIYHPDKISHLGEDARDNAEAHFKAVMKAYDVLSDKKKRASYDSIDDVDDSIPSERDAAASPQRFYAKFGSCFALNSRWSVVDRVPELGDDQTSIDTVHKFYDFWYNFKSWRDFSFDLEYDTDQAESREEKRWMERQNSKVVKQKKNEENTRIRKLVDLAYKHDPRLQRIRSEAKAKKDAAKLEKRRQAEERAKEEADRERRQKEEAAQRAEEDKVKRAAAKKEKEVQRQVVRKARQKLRAVARGLGLMDIEDSMIAVEKVCMDGTSESIESVASLLSDLDVNASQTNRAVSIMQRAAATPQEVLTTSSQDFPCEGDSKPNGVTESPPKLSPSKETVGVEGNGVKTPEILSRGTKAKASSNGATWTSDEMSQLSKGVAKFPGGTRDRWQKLADMIGTKTADEVLQKVNDIRASKVKGKSGKSSTGSGKAAEEKAFERFQEKKKGKAVLPQGNSSDDTRTAPPVTENPPTSLPAQPPNSLHFTPKEQSIFEGALKKFSSCDQDSKWSKVSSAVGRSSQECQQRFHELISYYKAKKQAQSSS